MKNLAQKILFLLFLILNSTTFAGETYTSIEGKCKITFPGEYEEEIDDDDDIKSYTVTGSMGGMIYMLIASVMEDTIEDEYNDFTERIAFTAIEEGFSTKIKSKKVLPFYVGNEMGYHAFIKPKILGMKYIGNYHVIIKDNIMYQFTALGLKKMYDERAALKFINSFHLID